MPAWLVRAPNPSFTQSPRLVNRPPPRAGGQRYQEHLVQEWGALGCLEAIIAFVEVGSPSVDFVKEYCMFMARAVHISVWICIVRQSWMAAC